MPGTPALRLTRAREAALRLLNEAGRADAEVSLVLMRDSEIQALNSRWRGIDKPTDVLSWPQDAPLPPDGGIDALGDVAISVDTAARQAAARGWDVEEEAALLLVHGILHLLGYEDETDEGVAAMRERERAILGRPLEKIEESSHHAAGTIAA